MLQHQYGNPHDLRGAFNRQNSDRIGRPACFDVAPNTYGRDWLDHALGPSRPIGFGRWPRPAHSKYNQDARTSGLEAGSVGLGLALTGAHAQSAEVMLRCSTIQVRPMPSAKEP